MKYHVLLLECSNWLPINGAQGKYLQNKTLEKLFYSKNIIYEVKLFIGLIYVIVIANKN